VKRSEIPLRPTMPIVAIDFETTDSDRHTCGIVQYGIALQRGPGDPVKLLSGLVNSVEPIEPGAQEVHGITNKDKEERGIPVADMLADIVKVLTWAEKYHALVVAYNLQFDWTVLTMVGNRNSLRPHASRYITTCALYDPLIVARTFDRYRKGGYSLDKMIDLWDLKKDLTHPDENHDAAHDAEAALLLARAQLNTYPDLGKVTHLSCSKMMMEWHAAWADDFEAFLRRERDPDAHIARAWPVIPPGQETQ